MKTIYQKYISTIVFLTLLSAVGCGNTPHKTAIENHRISTLEEAEGRTVTNAVAIKAEASDFVEIQFKPGSSFLSESSKSSLDSLIKVANHEGVIDEIIILSWSDEEYPSKKIKSLPKKQKELAASRNKVVEEYVKTMRSVEVNTYNMAERPNVISKLFKTTDSKLKNSLIAAGLPTTADPTEYASKASHSVILVKVR
ncbi:MAG: hypothetical protein H7281_06785 [Bacteriovorax sp.]|nr:hypothetical protein [Bacteriovorax sp.]